MSKESDYVSPIGLLRAGPPYIDFGTPGFKAGLVPSPAGFRPLSDAENKDLFESFKSTFRKLHRIMSPFDNIKQALKRADHFAPGYRTSNISTRLALQRRRHNDVLLPKRLAAVGIPNGKLLWDASEDLTTKLVTLDDIARGINRFVDTHRAAGNANLTYVMRWWRSLLFFDPRKL